MTTRRQWLTVCIAALLSIAAQSCAVAPITRIDENRDVYGSWSLEVRQAVLDGQVAVGMTAEMVYLSWGAPTRIVVSPMTAEEVWVYEEGDMAGKVYSQQMVVFRSGLVNGVDVRRF